MRFYRHFTRANASPYEGVPFRLYRSVESGPAAKFDAPASWPDETVTAYYRRASRRRDIPCRTRPVRDDDVPRWLWRRVPDLGELAAMPAVDRTGGEKSARDVIDRVVGAMAYWGWRSGYFDGEDDAAVFVDELRHLLCQRHIIIPPDHVRNAGIHWAYGLACNTDRHYVADYQSGRIMRAEDNHEPHSGPRLGEIAQAQAVGENVTDLCGSQTDARGWLRDARGIRFTRSAAQWHTCPRSSATGWSPNDSGFVFTAESACPLVALDASKFVSAAGKFDVAGFSFAVRLATVALDISLASTAYPGRATAAAAWDHRPLGLGLTNIAGLCAAHDAEYNSGAARSLAAATTALMTGTAYRVSAELASVMGAFPEFEINRRPMLRALRNHRNAAYGRTTGYQGLTRPPVPLDPTACPDRELVEQACHSWDRAIESGDRWGFRNAQVTLVPGARILRETTTPAGTSPCSETGTWNEEAGSVDSQIRMMAAVQPFLSGGIGSAMMLPPQLGFEAAAALYQLAWRLGIKGLTLSLPTTGGSYADVEPAGLRLLSNDGLRRTGSDGSGIVDPFDG